jgi:hypothetical protein
MRSSSIWHHFSIHSLIHPHRTENDIDYTTLIDHIGEDHLNSHPSLHMIDCLNNLEYAHLFLFPPKILQNPFLTLK